ncbi:hypothetical protein RAA17_23200 [Komagataeibacter rhaeticus]|nr:hypothetical protein [Komagataeibacter rhaeticus]
MPRNRPQAGARATDGAPGQMCRTAPRVRHPVYGMRPPACKPFPRAWERTHENTPVLANRGVRAASAG